MKYKTLLFDADGTLFDFSRSEAEAIRRTMLAFGIEPNDSLVRSYSEINDKLWKMLERKEIEKSVLLYRRFELFCEKHGYECDAREMAKEYMESLSKASYMIDGAKELCQRLGERFDMYIVTNGVEFIQRRRFANSGISEYFKDIFISGVVGFEKPDRRYFEYVAEAIPDFDKNRTIIIGDSLSSDIKGGIGYAIDTCWYSPKGESVPEGLDVTYTVRDYDELYKILTDGEKDVT